MQWFIITQLILELYYDFPPFLVFLKKIPILRIQENNFKIENIF